MNAITITRLVEGLEASDRDRILKRLQAGESMEKLYTEAKRLVRMTTKTPQHKMQVFNTPRM